DRAAVQAQSLKEVTSYDSGDDGPLVPGAQAPAPSPTRRALNELAKLQGYAVPAAIQLLEGQNKYARAYAAELLGRVGATAAIPQLDNATKDAATIVVSLGDSVSERAVGHFARFALERLRAKRAMHEGPSVALALADPVEHAVPLEI